MVGVAIRTAGMAMAAEGEKKKGQGGGCRKRGETMMWEEALPFALFLFAEILVSLLPPFRHCMHVLKNDQMFMTFGLDSDL